MQFKVIGRLELLQQLNIGVADFSQIGKFLTVYTHSTDQAVALAAALHRVTRGMAGPASPFDRRYRAGSIIFYRYGAFRPTNGRYVIRDDHSRLRPDSRVFGHAVPRWLDDPFVWRRRTSGRSAGPVGSTTLVFKAYSQRGKGGVYEAVDLSVSPARVVILKEGRRHGETDWEGTDGYARIKREAQVLRALQKAGVPVPAVHREFTQSGNRYLVLEKVAGRALIPPARLNPSAVSWRRAEKILDLLEPLLAQIHRAGWVWRDCKPAHLRIHRGTVRLLDFEGACRIDDVNALPWGSANYLPRCYHKAFNRQPGTLEDNYALGVIAFQLGTGAYPAKTKRGRAITYDRFRCPDVLRERIEQLLRY